MAQRIIVDIDNTLWDFAPVLYERIRRINPEIRPPSEWKEWNFWRSYLSSKVLYETIRSIHGEQDRFAPYPGAREFLLRLRENHFFIVIASHREKGTLEATRRWLEKYDLSFDEIHLSHDKTVLFDSCWAVVDDSPLTLDTAARMSRVRTGLTSPWNEGTDHPLFDDLSEVLAYLGTQCTGHLPGAR